MAGVMTRGVLFVHSAPRALCPHVEWAAGGVLGVRLSLDWIEQPAAPGMLRTEFSWQAPPGHRRQAHLLPCAAGPTCATRSPRSRAPASTAAAGATPPSWASSTP